MLISIFLVSSLNTQITYNKVQQLNYIYLIISLNFVCFQMLVYFPVQKELLFSITLRQMWLLIATPSHLDKTTDDHETVQLSTQNKLVSQKDLSFLARLDVLGLDSSPKTVKYYFFILLRLVSKVQ